jgi:hypothetical protein
MTTKIFLGSWLKLILLLLLVAGTHILILQFATHSIATLVAPKFTALTATEEEAFRHKQSTHRAEQVAEQTKDCEERHPNRTDRDGKFWFERCMSFASYSWYTHPAEIHEMKVIAPMVKEIQEKFLPAFFGLFYAIIGIFLLKALWRWLFETFTPLLRARFNGVKAKIADESILRTDKRLSAAVKQLDDLETLRERGMITEEVFRERKDEIKGALAKLNNGHQ